MVGLQAEEYRRQAAQRALEESAARARQAARDRVVDEAIHAEIARRRLTEVLRRLQRAAERLNEFAGS